MTYSFRDFVEQLQENAKLNDALAKRKASAYLQKYDPMAKQQPHETSAEYLQRNIEKCRERHVKYKEVLNHIKSNKDDKK